MSENINAGFTEQLKGFLGNLFETGDWPARWHCGTWSDLHGWLYILADLSIWAAYFAIPFLLFRILAKRKDIPFPKILWLFIAFILLCGLTHLMDAVIFWWPAYRLSALIRIATGVVSIFTVFALYNIFPLIDGLRTQAQLETEIEERKKAEQEAREQYLLQQATQELMKKKDEFMTIASHELKTPITSVKSTLQIVKRLVDNTDELKPVSPLVERASNQVNRLTSIINDLLDVTKIQAGKLDLLKTNFSIAELIDESVQQCLVKGTHSVNIDADYSIKVLADKGRIEQVLSNLLSNAEKYSPDSAVIDVSVEIHNQDKIKVSVRDYGIGIPDDKINDIFNRFFRVEHTSQNFSGLGLGLYITSEIIKQHSEQIDVTSVLGEGSTFWFTLERSR